MMVEVPASLEPPRHGARRLLRACGENIEDIMNPILGRQRAVLRGLGARAA